jgi:hypothetical protein
MVDKVFEDIAIVAPRFTGNARKAIDYGLFQKGLMDRAKGVAGYSPDEWQGLKGFVTDDFQRVGNFKEEMSIDEMIAFLQAWSPTQHWEGSFKRVSECDNVVFLELEERIGTGAEQNAVNTISVFQFDGAGKIHRLDVYLQAVMGTVEKGEAYDT